MFDQYSEQTRISNSHVIDTMDDINSRLSRSLAEFSARQIKWNDSVEMKIDVIKDRVSKIEITISEDSKK